MKKADKIKLVEKYQELKGQEPENITEAIQTGEPKLKPEEVQEIVGELTKPPEPTSLNQTFEEWIVEPVYIHHEAKRGVPAWRELKSFDKLKKVKDTRITPDRAELLNEQSEQSKIRYYLPE